MSGLHIVESLFVSLLLCIVATERDGFKLRIGTVVADRTCAVFGALHVRIEARKGAWLERTCKLAGLVSLAPFGVA